MRDIQQVLERWGGWACSDNSALSWSPVAAGFRGLVSSGSRHRLTCSDNDGLIVDSCVCRLQRVRRPEELEVIMLYYVYSLSKRAIGRRIRISEMEVRRRMSVAEGFIDGCLNMIETPLEMDAEVQINNGEKKSTACRKK